MSPPQSTQNLISEIYQLLMTINASTENETFTQTFRFVERNLFSIARNDITRQRRELREETDFIISGISALVRRLRNHRNEVSKLQKNNEKVELKKLNRQYAETRHLSDEVKSIFEADIKSLGQTIRQNEERIKNSRSKLYKISRSTLDSSSSSSENEDEDKEEDGDTKSLSSLSSTSSDDDGDDQDHGAASTVNTSQVGICV